MSDAPTGPLPQSWGEPVPASVDVLVIGGGPGRASPPGWAGR